MPLSKKDIEYVAKLARIHLKEEEKELYTKQLEQVLMYMEKLNSINTDNIEPTFQSIFRENYFREDKSEKTLQEKDILKNAPDKTGNFFKVKKVIE